MDGGLAELLKRSVEEGRISESLSDPSVPEELARIRRPLTSPRTETRSPMATDQIPKWRPLRSLSRSPVATIC